MPRRAADGFSLIDVLIATAILSAGILSLLQSFTHAAVAGAAARDTTIASILARQKVEELRSVRWAATQPPPPTWELATSPPGSLDRDTAGYVDYVDHLGAPLRMPLRPGTAAYIRRWSVEPLPAARHDAVVIQVLVTRRRIAGVRSEESSAAGGDVRLATIRLRSPE